MEKMSIVLSVAFLLTASISFSQSNFDPNSNNRLAVYQESCIYEIDKVARNESVSVSKAELEDICLKIKLNVPMNARALIKCALEEKKSWSDLGIQNFANQNLVSCNNLSRPVIYNLQEFTKNWNNSLGIIPVRLSSTAIDYLAKYSIEELNSAVVYARQLAVSMISQLGVNRFGLPLIFIPTTMSVDIAIKELRGSLKK